MIELLPCPFCGGEGVLQKDINGLPIEYFVFCPNCKVVETPTFSREKEAVKFWNRRVK